MGKGSRCPRGEVFQFGGNHVLGSARCTCVGGVAILGVRTEPLLEVHGDVRIRVARECGEVRGYPRHDWLLERGESVGSRRWGDSALWSVCAAWFSHHHAGRGEHRTLGYPPDRQAGSRCDTRGVMLLPGVGVSVALRGCVRREAADRVIWNACLLLQFSGCSRLPSRARKRVNRRRWRRVRGCARRTMAPAAASLLMSRNDCSSPAGTSSRIARRWTYSSPGSATANWSRISATTSATALPSANADCLLTAPC